MRLLKNLNYERYQLRESFSDSKTNASVGRYDIVYITFINIELSISQKMGDSFSAVKGLQYIFVAVIEIYFVSYLNCA